MSLKPNTQNQSPTGEKLNDQIAAQMLENIFDVCDTEPNSVPLDVLVSYSNYRKQRFALQKLAIIILLVLLCVLPFLFISPKFTIEAAPDTPSYAPKYLVTVKSLLPVNKVSASIDGYAVPVYETQPKQYSVEPSVNGELMITVTLSNHQTKTEKAEVSGIDITAPVLISDYLTPEGQIAVKLTDEDSGVDFAATQAVDENGLDISPSSWDEEKGIIYFDYPESSLNVFIFDHAGNKLQLVLTLK